MATVGFVLSPLSWWNDLLVNVPLAYAFATVVAFVWRDLFVPALVVGYWLTNVVGLVLLHTGAVDAISTDRDPYSRSALAWDLVLSVAYTLLILVLVWGGIVTYPDGLLG